VPVLRRTQPSPAAFVVPGGVVVPVAAAAASVWLLTGLTRAQSLAGIIAIIVGALFFLVFRSRDPNSESPRDLRF
jgi:hypothetical protein